MIIFEKLNIVSFKSIFNVCIDFNDLGNEFYSLEGKNNTLDFSSSNGSGKSTLFDALSYVLYGTTMGIYVKKEEYQNRNTNIPLKLTLEFYIDRGDFKGDYIIERTLNNTLLFHEGVNISELNKSETEKKILRVLNLTKEEFFSFTYLTQTSGGNFLGKTASEKLSVIKDFIFGEDLLQIKNTLSDKIKYLKQQMDITKSNIARLEGSIESLQKIKNNLSTSINNDNKIEDIEKALQRSKETKKQLLAVQQKFRELTKKKTSLENRYNTLCSEMQKMKKQYESTKNGICPLCKQELQDDSVKNSLISKASDLKKEANSIKKDLTDINSMLSSRSYKDIDNRVSEISEIVRRQEITIEDIKLQNKQSNIDSDIDNKKQEKDKAELQLEDIKSKYQQLAEVQKYFNTTFIQYVQQSFLSEIENYLNLYCYDVFNEPFSLKFVNNSLDLFIGNYPYSYFSGGERQRIDFLFVFAIKVVLSYFTNKCTNLLICDESLSAQDGVAFENCVDLINRLSSSSGLTTILVSHRENSNVSSNKILLERFSNKTNITVLHV